MDNNGKWEQEFSTVCSSVYMLSYTRGHSRELDVHCDRFTVRKLHSRLSIFSRGEGQSHAPHGSGPADAEAVRRLHSWGTQVELAEEFWEAVTFFPDPSSLFRRSAQSRGSVDSSDRAESMLLAPSSSEELNVFGEEHVDVSVESLWNVLSRRIDELSLLSSCFNSF